MFDITGPAGLTWSISLAALLMLILLAAGLLLTLHRAGQRLAGAARARRWLVALLNLVAFAAVALLLAPPERLEVRDQAAVLFTPGAPVDSASLPANRSLYALPGAAPGASDPRLQRLSQAGQLMLREPGLTAIEVRGQGLSESEWQQLPAGLGVRYEPPPLTGPVNVQWPRRLVAGEPLRLAGRLALPQESQVARLVLLDPSGLPVAETSARAGQSFALQAVPRATGAMTYRLQTWRGDALLSDEPVATFVQASRGANLLVVQSAPSFDTRQLVNWTADRGQQAVVLTQISRDRDLAQGFNTPEQLRLSLDSELLRWADLIVMDGRRWTELGAAQRQLVLEAVETGAGLLLLADLELAEWLEGAVNQALDFTLQAAEPDRVAWPLWPGGSPATPLPLAPWQFVDTTAHALTGSEEGPVLEAWQGLGAGRVAISLIRERQRWFTEGQAGNATRYWSYLMRTLARPASGSEWLAPASRKHYRAGEVFEFCIAGAGPVSYRLFPPDPALVLEGELVSHADGFPVACGRARATQPGWYLLELAGEDGNTLSAGDLSVRVYGDQEWLANDDAARQAASLARAEGSAAIASDLAPVRGRAFSPWWPFGALLLAGGLLWLERRLYDLE
jgi:hypothetical protein